MYRTYCLFVKNTGSAAFALQTRKRQRCQTCSPATKHDNIWVNKKCITLYLFFFLLTSLSPSEVENSSFVLSSSLKAFNAYRNRCIRICLCFLLNASWYFFQQRVPYFSGRVIRLKPSSQGNLRATRPVLYIRNYLFRIRPWKSFRSGLYLAKFFK